MSQVSNEAQDPELPAVNGATLVRFDHAWNRREVQGVGLGGVIVIAATASLLTRMYLERRARAREQRLAWLALRLAPVRSALPDAQLLSDRPHPRDVLVGAAVGLGLAGLISRVASGRSDS